MLSICFTAKDYESVGAALPWTLEQGLGAGFTPDVKEAWTRTDMTVSGVMADAAGSVPEKPAKKGLLGRMFG